MATPSVTVEKSGDGWRVTKGSDSWQITDKNKDGRFDSSDLVKGLNGNANSLSNDDMVEVWWQSLNAGDDAKGATAADTQRYNQYKEQQEAVAKKKAEAEAKTNTTATQPAKKKSFWGKLGDFCQKAMPFIPLALGIGGALTAWSTRSRNANDTALVLSNISGQVMNTMSMMAAMNALNNVKDFSVGNIGSGIPDYSSYSNLLAGLGGTTGVAPSANILDTMNGTNTTTTTTATAAQKRVFMNNLSSLYDNDVNDKFAKANGEWISQNVLDDEDAEYDDEIIEIAKQIKKTPSIPVDCIKVDKDDVSETKLTKKEAARLQSFINEYEKWDVQSSDNCLKYFSKDNYTKLKGIFAQITNGSELSQDDYDFIQKLLTDSEFRAPRNTEE